jgi:hypothetical protein
LVGQWATVLALFQQMRAAGIAGDTITYTAAIEAYARGGLDHSPPDAERYADDGADGEDGEDRGGEGEDCGGEEGEGGAGGRVGAEEGATPGDWEAAAGRARGRAIRCGSRPWRCTGRCRALASRPTSSPTPRW